MHFALAIVTGTSPNRTLSTRMDIVPEDVKIRTARISDAAALNAYMRHIYANGRHLITRGDEFHVGAWRQRYWIAKKQTNPYEICFLAERHGEIIGMLDNWVDRRRRVRHSTCFAMSVAEGHRHKGVGKKLLSQFIDWVQKHAILERIELHVHSDNEAAIALYKKLGFQMEGTRKQAIRYEDGRVVDDHVMALWPGDI